MQMPIDWNGLSMPIKRYSVHSLTVTINFKVRGVKQDSAPYIVNVILTYIPIKCRIVDPNVYRLLYCPE